MQLNKTANECWNILKYEIESIIDKFVSLNNKENGLERNTCQKKLLEKYRSSKLYEGVHRRTRKDEDYATEIRQSKISYEQKLACNIKTDSKSCYAYVRSKQNVRDKVGHLEDCAGNIISQGLLMSEDLNGNFCSVFPREDISSLLVSDSRRLNLTI